LGASTAFHPFIVSALGSDLMLLDRQYSPPTLCVGVLNKADFRIVRIYTALPKAAIFGVPSDRRQVVYLGVDQKYSIQVMTATRCGNLWGCQKALALNLRAASCIPPTRPGACNSGRD
jgi:hypothetical protein